jgi:GNAT superfamily N-acetyltransferase
MNDGEGGSGSNGIVLLVASGQDHWRQGRRLISEYADSLGLDLSFQDFEVELENLEAEYGPPQGAFFLAVDDDRFVGCAGLRLFSESTGEIKRLYLVPQARGRGIGRMLAQAVIGAGRDLGHTRLLLDTLPSMQEAKALYRSLGFVTADPYRYNPVAGTAFLELKL